MFFVFVFIVVVMCDQKLFCCIFNCRTILEPPTTVHQASPQGPSSIYLYIHKQTQHTSISSYTHIHTHTQTYKICHTQINFVFSHIQPEEHTDTSIYTQAYAHGHAHVRKGCWCQEGRWRCVYWLMTY